MRAVHGPTPYIQKMDRDRWFPPHTPPSVGCRTTTPRTGSAGTEVGSISALAGSDGPLLRPEWKEREQDAGDHRIPSPIQPRETERDAQEARPEHCKAMQENE